MRPTGNEAGAAMSSSAIDLALNGASNGLDVGASRSGHREPDTGIAGPELSRLLMHYWRVELARPVETRRLALDAVRARTHVGKATIAMLLPFALGDIDEGIVFRATTAYVGESRRADQSVVSGAALAADWIRRRLPLNRAAVFAALLSFEDQRVLELLLPLRQTLNAEEVASVQRRQDCKPANAARAFLQEWRSLLSTGGRHLAAADSGQMPPR